MYCTFTLQYDWLIFEQLQQEKQQFVLLYFDRWMDGWMVSLTKADLCSLIQHRHLDGSPIREGKGQVLGVGEEELLLPDTPEGHCVDQGHLQPVAPPKGLCLGLARARQLTAAASCLQGPLVIWEVTREGQRFR